MNNVDIMKALYQSFGAGDMPAVLGGMSPNIEWREAEGNPYKPDGQPWVGPDAIVQNLFIKLGGDWDGFTVTPHSFLDAGDAVVVEARYTGKYKATGRALDAQVCHVWKLENGKVTSFQQYTDTAQLQHVFGRP